MYASSSVRTIYTNEKTLNIRDERFRVRMCVAAQCHVVFAKGSEMVRDLDEDALLRHS